MSRYAAVRWATALACGLAIIWAMPEAAAATWYWNTTTTGLWTNGANWSNNATSGGTTGTVPTNDTTTDIAYFNQSSVNGTQTVQLNADQSIAGIVVANTGVTTIASNTTTPRLLTIGANGLTVLSAANNLTLGGASNPLNLALAASQTFANNASSRTLTVVGGISRTAGDTTSRTLTIDGAGSTALQGVVSDGGASGSLGLTKTGTGQLTLSAANTYTGATTVNSGTLRLDFSATGAPTSNIVNNASNSSGLTLGGGALNVAGKASTANSQQFNGLTLNRGANSIVATIGASGTVNLALGAVTRSVAGGVADFTPPTSGSITTTTANANFSGGQQSILGGYATVSGTTWAVSAGDGTNPGAITGLASYSSSFSAATDVDVPVGTSSPSSLTVNSLRFSGTSASSVISTVNVTGVLTIATGGILVNDMGATFKSHVISGGTLATGNGVDLVVIQNSARSGNYLGITSKMTGSMGLTKSGSGVVRLTGANDYTGPTNVLVGELTIGDNSTTGSLNPASQIFVAAGATFGVDRVSGTAVQGSQFGTISGEGGFRVTRGGTVTMNASNTYAGPTTVSGAATLNASSVGSWSAGNSTASNLGSPTTAANGLLTLSTGVLRYTGTGETTNRDVIGSSSGATGTFTIDQAGTGNLMFTGTLRSDGSGNGSQVLQLQGSTAGTGEIAGTIVDKTAGSRFTAVTKAGTGTWRLSGSSNTYGGVTTINGGVLEVASLANGGALSSTGSSSNAAANLVIDGGTLRYVGAGGSSDRNFTTGTNGGTIDASGSGALTLSGSSAFVVSNTAARLTFTGTSTAANTFSGILGDNGTGKTSFTKAGAGSWILTNANTYTGTTSVIAGTLQIGNAGTTGGLAATSAITGSAGATLAFSRSDNYGGNVSNTITGAINLSHIGSGTLTLSGNNSYSGNTTVSAGQLSLAGPNALGTGTSNVSGGVLNIATYAPTVGGFSITSGSLIGSGTLTAATYSLGGGTVWAGLGAGSLSVTANTALNGTSDATTVNLNAGSLTLGSDSRFTSSAVAVTGSTGASLTLGGNESFGSLSGAANVALGGNTLTVGSANTSTSYSGVLSGSGGVTKLGSGTFTISNANSYSGQTRVSAGVLTLGGANAISNQSSLLVDGGGFNLGAFDDTVATVSITSGSIVGSGKLSAATYALGGGTVGANLGAGSLSVTANTALNGTSDATTVNLNAGSLTLGSGSRFTSSAVAVTGSTGASLTLGGNESFGAISGAANVALGGNTLTVGGANTSTTYSGALSGITGALTKIGTGTFTLTGASTYTGNTNVAAGVLAVNGQLASAVSVSSGAVLGGSGVIGGPLSGNGLVSPGNSPGILTASQFNPTSGLDAAFEFTNLSPVYNAPSASVNDVLRLTDAGNPFASGLFTSGNVIDVYFNVDTVSSGQIYEGGFFTGLSAASLLAALDGTATFNYWAKASGAGTRVFGGVDYVSLTTVSGITGVTFQTAARTANFGSGDVSGSVTQFIIVPEPGGLLLAAIGAGLVAGALRARRLAIRGRIVRADHEASLARDAPGASP